MKLKHIVGIGLVLVVGYVALHWAFSHGGMANLKAGGGIGGNNVGAYAGAGFGR